MSDEVSESIRILLVDDHAVVRAGIRRLLEDTPRFTICGEVGTAREAVHLADVKRPDIILLDIGLPDGDGVGSISALKAAAGDGSHVLMLSMHDDPQRVERAFAAGADGYLLKDAAESELVAAIDALIRGERYLYPPLGAAMIKAAGQQPDDPLTDREREIVKLLALGHTNAEIAGILFLSMRTIESHRAHALAKLRLTSRADLVAWALKQGLLEHHHSS